MQKIDVKKVIRTYNDLLTSANYIFMEKFDWFRDSYRATSLGIYNEYSILCACEYTGSDDDKRDGFVCILTPYEYLIEEDLANIDVKQLIVF